MIWWYAVAALAVLLVVMTLYSRITVKFVIKRVRDDDRFTFSLRALFGLIRFHYDIPMVRLKGLLPRLIVEKEQSRPYGTQTEAEQEIDLHKIMGYYRQTKQLIDATKGFSEWADYMLSQWKCTRLRWTTHVGVGDAPETAVAAGIIWSLKTTLLGFAFQRVKLAARPQLAVVPQYNRAQFSTDALGIMEIPLGKAIAGGLLLLIRILKVKGGLKTWRTVLSKSQ